MWDITLYLLELTVLLGNKHPNGALDEIGT
jgi:hypothetical protein